MITIISLSITLSLCLATISQISDGPSRCYGSGPCFSTRGECLPSCSLECLPDISCAPGGELGRCLVCTSMGGGYSVGGGSRCLLEYGSQKWGMRRDNVRLSRVGKEH